METEFDQGVTSTYQMNQIMNHYETTLYANYAQKATENQQWRVFEQHITDDIEEYPVKMQNPFKIMIRWLKFEILDIEAILEAINKKNVMDQ